MQEHRSRRRRLVAALASVRLAVGLIAVYAIVLACATAIESQRGAAVARAVVYDSWWFTAINVLLAVNVLCAVLVRCIPPNAIRRQTGFLLTHIGVLVLLAGCLATQRWGIDAELPVYEGDANHIAHRDHGQLDLGFQVFLHQFRRRLDPGSTMPSHYSSRVDFLDLDKPPKKLRENVLITLNAPVDFTDPRTGRTYRLFQSSFAGPWLPGDAEYEQFAGNDRSRDRIFLSRFSVNYDPGRGLKYTGCLLVVLGIAVGYYSRWFGKKGSGGST